MSGPACFEQLHSAYESAFRQLTREVQSLDTCQRYAAPGSCAELTRRVERAEQQYRLTRDELAAFLLRKQTKAAA